MKRFDLPTAPRKWSTLQPKFLIGLVLSLVILGIIVGYVEFSQSRKDILNLMRIEAHSLIETMSSSGKSAALAYGEIEALLDQKIGLIGEFLLHLSAEHSLRP
ncbi:MAG: hypothetical protein D6814_10290, partial [Calditrichaeota bacterium]